MSITSQWELGQWIPKGWVHNSECGNLSIFQVGFKFEAFSDKCSADNKNAFVYVNKAHKSTSLSVIFNAFLPVFLMIMKPTFM